MKRPVSQRGWEILRVMQPWSILGIQGVAAPVRAETGSCGRHFGIADDTRFESHYVCAFIGASIDMRNDRYASPKTLEKGGRAWTYTVEP